MTLVRRWDRQHGRMSSATWHRQHGHTMSWATWPDVLGNVAKRNPGQHGPISTGQNMASASGQKRYHRQHGHQISWATWLDVLWPEHALGIRPKKYPRQHGHHKSWAATWPAVWQHGHHMSWATWPLPSNHIFSDVMRPSNHIFSDMTLLVKG